MKPFGAILLVLGALLMLVGASMETSTSVTVPNVSVPGLPGLNVPQTNEVHNLGLLLNRLLTFLCGCTFFATGGALVAGAAVREALTRPVDDFVGAAAPSAENEARYRLFNRVALGALAALLIYIVGSAFFEPAADGASSAENVVHLPDNSAG